jgi:hypothetical protein
MKKIIFILVLCLATIPCSFSSPFYSALGEWFMNWNVSVGVASPLPSGITDPNDYSIHIVDGYSDDYYFSTDGGMGATSSTGLGLTIQMPLYYNDKLCAGIGGVIFIDRDTGFSYSNPGAFVRLKRGLVAVSVVLGFSYASVDYDAGELLEAWPGDPGAYLAGDFYAPGSKLSVSGINSTSAFGGSISVKYQIHRIAFVNIGYSYLSKSIIDSYSYTLTDSGNEVEITPEVKYSSVSIPATSSFFAGIGFGLL